MHSRHRKYVSQLQAICNSYNTFLYLDGNKIIKIYIHIFPMEQVSAEYVGNFMHETNNPQKT
jgi:hypothetical protein